MMLTFNLESRDPSSLEAETLRPFQVETAADLTWLAQPNMLSTVKKRRQSSAERVPQATRRSTLQMLLAVMGLVVVSRVGYYLAGVRFDASSLPWFWQYANPALLKANLAQSLWYLHSQPPAFNAFLGVVLGLFAGHETVVFTVCYLLIGLVFTAGLFLLLKELGVPDTPNAVLTAVYVASPACVLYENWLFYTYPLTVLLLLAALFWRRFVRLGHFLDALLLFACAALLALTWSLFHLIWLLGLVLALALYRRRDWRKMLAAAAVPALVVMLWYGKNLVQVGEFTGSTWFGMNFSKMTNSMLTAPERRALYDNGTISAVSMIPPFSEPGKYSATIPMPGSTGIPVLDEEVKPAGIPNFNNTLFVAVSRQYGRDAFRILAARPAAYLRGLAESYLLYFLPASAYLFLNGNAVHIRSLDRIVSIIFNGRFVYHSDHTLRQTRPSQYYQQAILNTGWFLMLAYVVVLALGLLLLLRPSSLIPHSPSLFFLWFSVAWMTFVANALEVGENNRFRFVTDPLVFTFLVAVTADWLRRRGRPARSMTRK
jgi:hypothetical protein